MGGRDFSEVVDLIVKEDPRYDKGAYFFLRKALDHTLKRSAKESGAADNRHVSGQELLGGIREYALDQYGPMTQTLFERWGLTECRHFGDLVFNLVDYKVFGKTEEDRMEDFESGYDFEEAFVKPFLPARPGRPDGPAGGPGASRGAGEGGAGAGGGKGVDSGDNGAGSQGAGAGSREAGPGE